MEKTKFDFKETANKVLKFLKGNIPLVGLVIILIVSGIATDTFFSDYNVKNVLRSAAVNGLLSFGMLFVILSGGIDLSVGSVLAFSSMVMAKLIVAGTPAGLAILVSLLIGGIAGAINGILISKGRIQAMIATLATALVFRGLTLYISNAVPVSRLGDGVIGWMGRGFLLGIPVPVYILLLVFGVSLFVLRKTVFGKSVYAIGGNIKGAQLSGIKVESKIIYVYIISGILAALAGVILTSRIDSAVPTAAIGYETNAIAATVIGGASLAGGRGKATNTLIGILIIAIIGNLLNLLGVSDHLQQIVTGLIIIAAVLADRRKSSR